MGIEKYVESIEPRVLPHGICKIIPPAGWWDAPNYDEVVAASQRGAIPCPVRQCVSGARGSYALTLLERPPESLLSFRRKADAAAASKLPKDLLTSTSLPLEPRGSGCTYSSSSSSGYGGDSGDGGGGAAVEDAAAAEAAAARADGVEKRVRRFWKTLSPLMDPPVYVTWSRMRLQANLSSCKCAFFFIRAHGIRYGADALGTLFEGHAACGWNPDNLDTPLKRHAPPIQVSS